MADLGIDKNSLPGVKEVCRDFAVLEDHTLAYSLQEQEIENHLASNIHKSRLVQQDLQVAKRLQEEEDLRAKAQIQRQHKDIERSDNEIAQEIQEQLVRQAEQQRQQEQKDEAIARMLQEKEMKEERRRQKQLEAHYEEDYYEDKGASRPRDRNKGRYPECEPAEYSQNERPCHCPSEGSRDKRHKYDLPEGQQSECYEQKNSKHKRDNFPEYFPSDSNRSTYSQHEPPGQRKDKLYRTQDWPAEATGGHSHLYAVSGDLGGTQGSPEVQMVVRRKERQVSREREKERKREANAVGYREKERESERDKGHNLDRERDYNMRTEWDKDRERDRERNYNKERSRERHKETDYNVERTKDRERGKEKDYNVEMELERHKNRVHNVEKDRKRYKERDYVVGRDKDRERHPERDYNVGRNKERCKERAYSVERDKERHRATDKKDRELDYSLNTEWEEDRERHGETHRSVERDARRDRHRDRENNGERLKDKERRKDGHGNRGTDSAVPSTSHVWLADVRTDEDRWTDRARMCSWDDDVLEELSPKTQRRRERRGHRDLHEELPRARSHSCEDCPPPHSPREPGRKVRGEYGMREATQGISRMDLREQELKDLEVARKLQEEELKASQMDKRAAQVAQDEEIARLLMEEEKRVYKKSRDREKPCMERRPEGDGKPGYEEVVRPRSRDEYYQKPRNHKADRPPSRSHDYENVDSSYLYPAANHPSRASPGPETTYKGSYNRQ